jgi:hypothetical protein
MPLFDGEPADDGDIWYRVLTEDSYIKKGKIERESHCSARCREEPAVVP